jgi:hypothetical protein
VASGGRLAGVDVTDHDDIDMGLFLSHGEGLKPYDLTRLKEQEVNSLPRLLQTVSLKHELSKDELDHLLEQNVDLVLTTAEVAACEDG